MHFMRRFSNIDIFSEYDLALFILVWLLTWLFHGLKFTIWVPLNLIQYIKSQSLIQLVHVKVSHVLQLKGEREYRTILMLWLELDFSSVQLDDLLWDAKPETNLLILLQIILMLFSNRCQISPLNTIKVGEQSLLIFFLNARPSILYNKYNFLEFEIIKYLDLDKAQISVSDCVLHQVKSHLHESLLVSNDLNGKILFWVNIDTEVIFEIKVNIFHLCSSCHELFYLSKAVP